MSRRPVERGRVSAAGPLEQSLSDIMVARTGEALSPEAGRLDVESCPRSKVGDFRVDLRPVLGDGAARRELPKEVATEISSWPEVERATGVPPRVYVLSRLGFLRECVTEAVLGQRERFGSGEEGEGRVTLVSFSSPNANKPLHLGHLRNNVIGMALANLFSARGWRSRRGEVVSDWGVHICQAVLGYERWGNGATPDETGEKSDHFVGRFYVRFHEEAATTPGLEDEAAGLLELMEAGDERLLALNARVTKWAEKGIRKTYKRLGTRLDLIFREGDTRAGGKAVVAEALASGRCHQRSDGSVYVDLGGEMGEVTLLRKDGSPVVYTQLIGFHVNRFRKHPFDVCPTLLGREWEAGASVVDEILSRWGYDFVDRIERVHYGMVRLREGRMKSRAGTTVSADALLDRSVERVSELWGAERGGPPSGDDRKACRLLAVGVVKYLFLGVRRTKDLLYDEEALWAPALERFAAAVHTLAWAEGAGGPAAVPPTSAELRRLLNHVNGFPAALARACAEREPAHVTRFADELCSYVRGCQYGLDAGVRESVAIVLRRCLDLLNIDLPSPLDSLPAPFAVSMNRANSAPVGQNGA